MANVSRTVRPNALAKGWSVKVGGVVTETEAPAPFRMAATTVKKDRSVTTLAVPAAAALRMLSAGPKRLRTVLIRSLTRL